MVVMSALVWYIVPGFLGRAYDLRNESVGPDLFDVTMVKEQRRVIERYTTVSEYRVVSDLSDASDFLDVSGKLALKIKTGSISVEGAGNYLTESSSFDNKIDLLIKVHYETVTTTLPKNIQPLKNWRDFINGTTNSHYIRSISYGGDLLASVSFIAKNAADKEVIKAEIQGEFSSSSGTFGGGLKGNLEKIQEKTKSTASMSINYYATVPLETVPSTIEGLTNLVERFPDEAKKVNEGWGVPLKMEVFSLENLVKDFKEYVQTSAYIGLMNLLDEQLTDIRDTRRRLVDWMKTFPPLLPDSQVKEIGKFTSKLEELNFIYCKVVANMDLSENSTSKQFKEAFDAYKKDIGYSYPSLYVRELSRLKTSVLQATPSIEADFGGGHYSYWGSDTCPSEAVLVYSGTMSSTNRNTIGSSKFICLPEHPEYYSEQVNEDDDEDIFMKPQIEPIVFVSRKKGSNAETQMMKCATCRVPGKSSITVLSGMTKCPSNFTKQYEGVLVSTVQEDVRGELICLDVSKNFKKASEVKDMSRLTEVSPKCGQFPRSGNVAEDKAIPCVVCSIKKETASKAEVLQI